MSDPDRTDRINVNGFAVALTHEHRGGFASDPATLRPAPDMIDRVGGASVVAEVVAALYARIERDPVLSRVFPHIQTGGIQAFFVEWLGGEPSYSDTAWMHRGLDRFHRRVHITPSLAARWLCHLRCVLSSYSIEDDAAREMLTRLGTIARAMVNADDPPADDSELVKSCDGVQTRRFHEHDALRGAAARGRLALVREAVSADASVVHFRGSDGRSLLWEAASRGRSALVEFLLQQGADPHLPGCDPTSINLACSSGARLGTAVMVTPLGIATAPGDDRECGRERRALCSSCGASSSRRPWERRETPARW